MKQLHQSKLSTMLKDVTGASFISFTYESPVDMKKTGNPYRDSVLTKSQSVSGNVGTRYDHQVKKETSVARTVLSEIGMADLPTVGEHKWGEHDGKNIIVNPKTGEESLQLVLTGNSHVDDVEYFLNGDKIQKETVAEWLPTKKPWIKDGCESEIVVRAYRLDRIKTVKFMGEEYEIVHG